MAEGRGLLLTETSVEANGDGVTASSTPAGTSPPPPQLKAASRREVDLSQLPWGVRALERLRVCRRPRSSYKVAVYLLTFICYATYHLSRKPFSVVKVVLCPECALSCVPGSAIINLSNKSNCSSAGCGWAPFNGSNGRTLLGSVDYAELFSYALALFISGQIADRMNLRYYLTIGLMGIATSVTLLGVAYFAEIHYLWYFILVQILGGVMQATGWPGVVSVFGSWFGRKRRGLLMGVWNAHTSVGNILSTIIPSFWADSSVPNPPWGWSFLVPAFITAGVGVLIFLFLVPNPKHVGLPPPTHHLDGDPESRGPAMPSGVGRLVRSYNKHSPRRDSYSTFPEENGLKKEGEGEGEGSRVSGRRASDENVKEQQKKKAIGFFRAFLIPGVIEYSLALFFSKLVSYTFLYWLPFYVKCTHEELSSKESAWLATIFDVGGILGSIIFGVTSDLLHSRAVTCVISLALAVPSLFFLRFYGGDSLGVYIFLLIACGAFIIGPYAIITTAVSTDLGNHQSLKDGQNAKATVTGIIDGTGSLGAAFGPLIIGVVTDKFSWNSAFYVLMVSCFIAALFLSRLVFNDMKYLITKWRTRCSSRRSASTTVREDRDQLLEESQI